MWPRGGRIYGGRDLSAGDSLSIRVPDVRDVEFRVMSDGAEFVHEGVELEPLLLDRQAATVEELQGLINALAADPASAEALHHLIERLAGLAGPDAAEKLRAEVLAASGSSAKVNALFQELNTPGRPRRSKNRDHGLSRELLLAEMARLPLQIINLPPQRESHFRTSEEEELLRRGYRPEFVHANRLHRSLREPRLPWQEDPKPGSSPTARPRSLLYEALSNSDYSFQVEIARGHGMTAFCPVSGEQLKSSHGFCQHIFGLPQNVYRFEGAEVFYVWAGGFSNAKMFLYMPRTGTVLPIEEPGLRWYPYMDMVRELSADMLLHAGDVHDYLDAPTRPAAVTGLNNIGHFFWNDLSGLQRVIDNDLVSSLAAIVKVRSHYFDYEKVFPELPRAAAELGAPSEVFAYFLRRRLTPVRFTDCVISPELFRRVREAAARQAGPAGRPPVDAPRPLLLVNLRAHNKVWVDQAEGYANILNAVYEEYGSVSAFLDGTPDCAGLAAELRKHTRSEIPLYDGLSLSLSDTLNYMDQIDAYLCVVGAGMTLINCFTDKRGVTHAEHGHMDHLQWWPEMRPEAPQALAPPKSAIKDLGVGWYCNYEVDWRLLLDLLRQVLDREFDRRPAT
jgi:hypothetical protein